MLEMLQWPAMVASIMAAWLIASPAKYSRNIGFWTFLLSNVLWLMWGWNDGAYALVGLQVALAAMNIRGVLKTENQH